MGDASLWPVAASLLTLNGGFFLSPLALFVMPAIPDRSMFSVPPEEADSVQTVAGVERADEVVALTNARFRRWFVDSGIIRAHSMRPVPARSVKQACRSSRTAGSTISGLRSIA